MRILNLFMTALLMIAVPVMNGCEKKEQIGDPKDLYEMYLSNDAAREKKVSECRLLSLDEQAKRQECLIAFKADGDKAVRKKGSFSLGVVKKNMNEGVK